MKHLLALILLTVFSSTGYPADDPWAPLQFLVGDWKGDGNAEGSLGNGVTSFHWEVGHQVLVRRDATTYAASAEKPAFTYEALMVIYKSPTSNAIEANYYDSGDHVVSYRLSPESAPGLARFVSHGSSAEPTFRLSYALQAPNEVAVRFEMEPPGSHEYKLIASGVVRKQ